MRWIARCSTASGSGSLPPSLRGTPSSRRCPTLRRLRARRPRAAPTAPAGCFWADQGRLLAGRYPGAPQELEAAGVTLFVDLTEEDELEPYGVRLSGARHVRFPILDM